MLAGRRCVHQQWHGELLIVHHHRQHSCLCACSRSKFPIAPMGFSHVSRFVLAGWRCAHLQRHGDLLIVHHHGQHSWLCACSRSKVPIAPMGNADALALILACTTATDTSVNYRRCMLKRPCKVPIAPMGFSHVLRLCLQGGGVDIIGGPVSFSWCTITGNLAYGVRAHAQKFPSPQRDKAWLTCPVRFSSFMMGAASNYQAGVRAICA